MIGRGTRLWTDPYTGLKKQSFLIFDFWNNFAYFNMNTEGEVTRPTEALPVRLFRLRLEKLLLLRGRKVTRAAANTVTQLQVMLAQLPGDNINIQPYGEQLTALTQTEAWVEFNEQRFDELSRTIAPLLRFLPDVSLPVMTFETRTEQLAVAYLAGQTESVATLRRKIEEDLALLPPNLPPVEAQRDKIAWVSSPGFWEHLDYKRILDLQTTFAPLMRYRRRRQQQLIALHLPDQVARRWVTFGPTGEGTFAESYREQVEAHIKDLAAQHPTLRKLQQREPLGEADIQALAQTLNQADLFITEATLRQAYDQPEASLFDFIRHILGLSYLSSREEQIKAAFDEFITAHPHFSARQITFLRVVRSQVLRRAQLTGRDLERPPFNRVGQVQTLFNPNQVDEILAFANQFTLR